MKLLEIGVWKWRRGGKDRTGHCLLFSRQKRYQSDIIHSGQMARSQRRIYSHLTEKDITLGDINPLSILSFCVLTKYFQINMLITLRSRSRNLNERRNKIVQHLFGSFPLIASHVFGVFECVRSYVRRVWIGECVRELCVCVCERESDQTLNVCNNGRWRAWRDRDGT